MAYLLDANVFIQARRLHYGFDFCPAFWDWLTQANAAGTAFSVEKVDNELHAGTDELSDWADAKGPGFFLPADGVVLATLPRVSVWASTQNFTPAAVNTFLSVADYWLVAHALAHGHTVVTHEKPSDGLRQIKIPNACVALGVPCVTPFERDAAARARTIRIGRRAVSLHREIEFENDICAHLGAQGWL